MLRTCYLFLFSFFLAAGCSVADNQFERVSLDDLLDNATTDFDGGVIVINEDGSQGIDLDGDGLADDLDGDGLPDLSSPDPYVPPVDRNPSMPDPDTPSDPDTPPYEPEFPIRIGEGDCYRPAGTVLYTNSDGFDPSSIGPNDIVWLRMTRLRGEYDFDFDNRQLKRLIVTVTPSLAVASVSNARIGEGQCNDIRGSRNNVTFDNLRSVFIDQKLAGGDGSVLFEESNETTYFYLNNHGQDNLLNMLLSFPTGLTYRQAGSLNCFSVPEGTELAPTQEIGSRNEILVGQLCQRE